MRYNKLIFKEEDVIGIFNPETGKVIIKGQYCIDTIVSELEIDMPDNAMIILTHKQSIIGMGGKEIEV